MKLSADQTFTPGLIDTPIKVQSLATCFRKDTWENQAFFGRDEHLLLWITRGHARMLLEGIPKGIGVFNAVFIPAGTPFSIELINTFGQVIRFDQSADIPLPTEARLLKISNTVAQQELGALLDALHTELTSIRPSAENAVEAYGRLVAVWLERQIIADIFMPPKTAAEKLVIKYCRLVEECHASGRNTGDYADELNITLTHLSRTCKDVVGQTAGAILHARIIHAAKGRLLGSSAPVSKISNDLGFSTPGNFARLFQQHTGRSPSFFRRSNNSV